MTRSYRFCVRLAAVFSPGATANSASLGVDAWGRLALVGAMAPDTAVGVIRLLAALGAGVPANAGEGVALGIAVGVMRRFGALGGAAGVGLGAAFAGLEACFGAGLPTNDCSCFFVIFEIGGQLFFFNSRARLYTSPRVSPFCLRAMKTVEKIRVLYRRAKCRFAHRLFCKGY
jgi:hypothetical protein